jgi:hypothetical protein
MVTSCEPAGGDIKEENGLEEHPMEASERKKIVVVGLGMVGIAFM